MPRTENGIIRRSLPREVLKWLQSLDLSYPVRNARRDLSNGFLVAEIFSWYFPQDVQMHSYDNGISLPTKLGNWSQLERFFTKRSVGIPKEMIDGSIHCKIGAAELLIQTIYTLLTNRIIRSITADGEIDFTDENYQLKLPIHARATASHAIKNNLKITEFMTEPNTITTQEKAHTIIERHLKRRSYERLEDPARFNIKPTLGELAHRHCPPTDSKLKALTTAPKSNNQQIMTVDDMNYREIQVRQAMDKPSSQPALPVM